MRFAKTGDAGAFAEIIRRHAGLVYGAALRIVADMDRASDVAQETFLQLTKDAHSVTGSLPGWLHRVATHKAIDQMRRDASRRRREAEYAAGQPCEVTHWKDLSRYVDEELSKLDDQTRDVLVAHFLQGRTTRQIAMSQGMSQATVSRRIDTGVTRLRATLRKRGILIAAGVLSTLLGENAVQAAPPVLMAELGKMAIVGGPAAATGAASASTVHAIAGAVLTGVKAKAVVVMTVAVIGVGSVVTYQHATRSPSSRSTVTTRSPTQKAMRTVSRNVSSSQSAPIPTAGLSDAVQKSDALAAGGPDQPGTVGDTTAAQAAMPQPGMAPTPAENAEPVPDGGNGGTGFAMGIAGSGQPPEEPPQQDPGSQTGGMFYYGAATLPSPATPGDPNDSNDRGSDEEP
jgi:RNA polymerase sigma factor (sigma-70 family)